MALSSKERQAALRLRRATAGLKEVRGVWLSVNDEKRLKQLIKDGLLESIINNHQ